MKITKDDFMKWSPELPKAFHRWEVWILFGSAEKPQIRLTEFPAEEYDTPEEQYEALCEYINGCRFSNTEYHVFCDDKIVLDF